MIRLEDVCFSYGESDRNSLSNVTLEVADGECVLLCGRSGCGKSTLLQVLNGIIPSHVGGSLSGTILVNGVMPVEEGIQRLSAVVGSVFQNPKSQFFNLNTTEELLFACSNHRISHEEMMRRLDETKDAFGVAHLLDRNIFELSGGEKQRLACAGVLIHRPKLLLLDEPSSNLDAESIAQLGRLIKTAKEQGTTIVVAEHRLYYLMGVSDRVFYMSDGRVEHDYTNEEFRRFDSETRASLGLRDIHETPIERGSVGHEREPAIVLRELNCSYKKHVAVAIDELTLPSNTVVALVGKNGAGKSTLASALTGIRRCDGSIVAEKPLKRRERTRRSFLVFQDVNHQLFTESVLEELLSGSDDDEQATDQARDILARLDLTEQEDLHPLALSGGQKQRVAVATALFMQKRYLIFDEPTSGLDYGHMMQFASLVRALRFQVEALLIITHDRELINVCCDRVVEMEAGRIVADYPTALASAEESQRQTPAPDVQREVSPRS